MASSPTARPAAIASDDPGIKFLVVVLAAQRARQLTCGARPRVDAAQHNRLWIAVREVTHGLVSWSVEEPVPARPAESLRPAQAATGTSR